MTPFQIRARIQSLLTRLALRHLDGVVHQTVQTHPGLRCFELDKLTLNSYHDWGTKHHLVRLEQQGRIVKVIRENNKTKKKQPAIYHSIPINNRIH